MGQDPHRPRGDGVGPLHVVQRHDDGRLPRPQLEQQVPHVGTADRVERARRLVEDDELRPRDQGDREAEALFRSLGLTNITARVADGSFGLPEQAPFDRIMVTAAAEDPPGPLLSQLKPGGIMVVPVGQSDAVQTLIKVMRRAAGFDYEELRQVRFVPLVEGLGQT